MKVDIYQVDAFADQIFGGNPAGVVPDASGLSDDQMQKIAREMNLSETAFVFYEDGELRLRYFTPQAEIKFCGHATVATLYTMAKNGIIEITDNEKYINVNTGAGKLKMGIHKVEDDFEVSFTAPELKLKEYKDQADDFAKRLGIPVETLIKGKSIYHDENLNYLYIPVISLDKLGELEFNFDEIIKNFESDGTVVFCLYTTETLDESFDFHARGLAPLVGVNEDPVTGSMQAGLVESARLNDMVSQDQNTFRVEQGHFIDRPGFTRVEYNEGNYTVYGRAVEVFKASMQI